MNVNFLRAFFPVRIWLAVLVGANGLSAQSTGTALVRHAPTLNGNVSGSLQQMTAESATLNGGAAVTGDWFVPGVPTVKLNGRPSYGGTIDGAGSGTPANYQITLNGNGALRHVIRRTDAVALPVIAVPPVPAGTRSVSINNSGQSAGDFATLKNLTLNGNVGQLPVPPGTYGDFTANGGSGFVLGVAGAAQPAVYNFQHLTLNGQSQFQVIGPVLVTVANGVAANGNIGGSAHASWLRLNIASGGFTLNGNVAVYAYVTAPSGTVTINGNSQLVGGLVADRLTLNGNSWLRLEAPANQPPTVSLLTPPNGATYVAPASLTLQATASDPDGSVAKVEFYRGATKLGEAASAPYSLALSNVVAGSYSFTARAIDNLGASTDSTPVIVTVTGSQPPTVSVTAPAAGAVFTAPASFPFTAVAADDGGSVAKVEFFIGTTKIGEDLAAPFETAVTSLAVGNYQLTARATDNLGAVTTSSAVAIAVQAPNQLPTVALTAPPSSSVFPAPASFTLVATASDTDGTVAKVEFYQGAVKLGESTAAPYQFAVSDLGAGIYAFTARAYDDAGGITNSAASSITANQQPVVALTSPTAGAVFTAPASILLTASASDPDGSIAKVEFYQGTTKIGEAAASPFQFTWPGVAAGAYSLTARAYDNFGATATSAARAITVQSTQLVLPYFTGFESTDGYALGGLAGQNGWTASGAAAIAGMGSYQGVQSLQLSGGTPVATATHTFPAPTGQSVVFVDVFVKPIAAPTAASGIFVQAESAKVAFVQAGAAGELYVLNGNGSGGGTWTTTGFKTILAANGQPAAWLRVTLREDFAAKQTDLYVNGRLVAYDFSFTDNAVVAFTQIGFVGQAAGPAQFDDLFIGFDNPLFPDADKDGMDDGWESAHGLNPAVNDRNADRDSDGLSNIREFQLGTFPDATDSDGDGVSDVDELAQGRNPTKGAVPDATGAVNLRVYRPAK